VFVLIECLLLSAAALWPINYVADGCCFGVRRRPTVPCVSGTMELRTVNGNR
jgi:hypothetical protein